MTQEEKQINDGVVEELDLSWPNMSMKNILPKVKETTTEEIVITNLYFDQLSMLDQLKSVLFTTRMNGKDVYWLTKIFDALGREGKIYSVAKGQLVKTYAIKGENGEPLVNPDQSVGIEDPGKFTQEMQRLHEQEVRLGINKVCLRLQILPNLSINEMRILLPLIEPEQD